jgi:fatty acid desaturase
LPGTIPGKGLLQSILDSPTAWRWVAIAFINRFGSLFWGVCIGVVALYAFFLAIGGFSPGEVVGLTVGVLVLATLFLLHGMRLHRELREHGHEDLMHELHRSRERRGF